MRGGRKEVGTVDEGGTGGDGAGFHAVFFLCVF